MYKLNENQQRTLRRNREMAREALEAGVDKIIAAKKEPGEVAYRLGWDTGEMMYNDLLTREMDAISRALADKADLDSLTEWYTREIMRWSPQHSTNPFSNVEEELKRKVQQKALEIVDQMKHLAD